MANQDWAFGLQPVRGFHGESPETIRYPLKQQIQAATPYTTKIYKGAIVLWNETVGHVKANAVTNPSNVVGVAAEYYRGSASTQTDLAVWPMGPGKKFVIQSDGGTNSRTRAFYLMKNFAVAGATGGNTNTGISTMELDESTGVIATAKPLKVLGFALQVGDTVAVSHVNVVVELAHGFGIETDSTVT